MTKAELVVFMSKEAKISKAAGEKALNALMSAVKKALKKGERLTLPGFISMSVGRRKARKGRNPQTGQEIRIPAGKVVKFKAGKALRDAIK